MDLFVFDDATIEATQPNEYATYFKVNTQESLEAISKRIAYHFGSDQVGSILKNIADYLDNK